MSLAVLESDEGAPEAGATFFYDLGDPDAYLIAERIRSELPVICDWEPVHAAPLGLAPKAEPDVEALALRARMQELLPFRLPSPWPPDSAFAMRAATYAKGGGKSIAYSLAAFRQAFAGGRDLGDEATVLLAAAACEMHPAAVLAGSSTRATMRALARAGERALAAGVRELPAFAVAGEITSGPQALDEAVAALARA